MACLALQPPIFLDTGELRPSSASIPGPCTSIRFTLPQSTPPGIGPAEHHPQSLFPPDPGRPTAELGQWLQRASLADSSGAAPHIRTFLSR